MLNYIWCFIVVFSVFCSIFAGNADNLSKAFTDSTAEAMTLLMTLAGIIGLWSGLMKIAERSGLTAIIARLFAPLLHRLFPRLDKNGAAFEAITMNISANLLGLGSTATPLGLRAMRELRTLSGSDEASDEMVWEVCRLATYDAEMPVYGLDELPVPSLYPRPSRELLRAVVMVRLGIGMRTVDVKALDEAYTEAFPHSTPLNVGKKRRRRRTAGGDKGRTILGAALE